MDCERVRDAIARRDDVRGGPGVDGVAIAEAERALDATFSPSLREYLRGFGWLEIGNTNLNGLGSGIPTYLDLVSETRWEREQSGNPLPTRLIPLHNDGAGNLYCIDVDAASPDYETVVRWDHDVDAAHQPTARYGSLEAWLLGFLTEG